MATRIVDVTGFDLVTGHTADVELRASVNVDPAVTRTQLAGASVAAEVGTESAAALTRDAGATRATTATMAAAATVTAATDLTSSIVAGVGTYGVGMIVVPGWDQPYKMTLSNTALSTGTPALEVRLPTPSTPDAAHWLTITYTVSNRSRRIYHRVEDTPRTSWAFKFVDGLVIEPGSDIGDVTTLDYTWDTADYKWYVSSYTAEAAVRDYGTYGDAWGLPVYFSPEAQASGDWTAIHDAIEAAIGAYPAATLEWMSDAGISADVASNGAGGTVLFECAGARGTINPAAFSGISGLWGHPFARSIPTLTGIPGLVTMHELGHAIDAHFFTAQGTPYGVNPRGSGGDLTPVTYYSYHAAPYEDRVEWAQLNWGDLIISYTQYDIDGNVVDYIANTLPSGNIRDEQEVYDLYPGTDGSNYVRSNRTEWTAHLLFLIHAEHVAGYSSATFNSEVGKVGGTSIYNDFRDWAILRGVVPSSW